MRLNRLSTTSPEGVPATHPASPEGEKERVRLNYLSTTSPTGVPATHPASPKGEDERRRLNRLTTTSPTGVPATKPSLPRGGGGEEAVKPFDHDKPYRRSCAPSLPPPRGRRNGCG